MTAVQPALDGMPEPPPTARQQQAADFDEWMDAIRPAFEAAARTGQPFTCYEIAHAHRLPEPPDGAHMWGRAMSLFREEGLLARAGWACSSRPTTHQSGVRRWRGTRAAQRGDAA